MTRVLAPAVAALLALASCGVDFPATGGDPASTTGATGATAGDDATDGSTDAAGGDAAGGPGEDESTSEFCAAATNGDDFVDVGGQLDPTRARDVVLAELDASLEAIDALIDVAPAEVEADFEALRDFVASIKATWEDLDPGDPPTAAVFSDLDFDVLSGPVTNILQYVVAECGRLPASDDPSGDSDDSDDSGGDASEDVPGDPDPPDGLGDDAALDLLAAACFDGDFDACDELFFSSDFDSDYEAYGATCAGRAESDAGSCGDRFG